MSKQFGLRLEKALALEVKEAARREVITPAALLRKMVVLYWPEFRRSVLAGRKRR